MSIDGLQTCIDHLRTLDIAQKSRKARAHHRADSINDTLMKGFEAELEARHWVNNPRDSSTSDSAKTQAREDEKVQTDGIPDIRQSGTDEIQGEVMQDYTNAKGHSATGALQNASLQAAPHTQSFCPDTVYSHGSNATAGVYQTTTSAFQTTNDAYRTAAEGHQPDLMSHAFFSPRTGANDHGMFWSASDRVTVTLIQVGPPIPCFPQMLYQKPSYKDWPNGYLESSPYENAYAQPNETQVSFRAMRPVSTLHQHQPSFTRHY